MKKLSTKLVGISLSICSLLEVLEISGFSGMVKLWEMAPICVKIINDENSSYFTQGKGLRQGEALAPLLFNLVADIFTRILKKAANYGLINGLLPNVWPGGIISLQYAVGTIMFLENKLTKARHLKWLLACFENLSGIRTNYDKCDLMTIGISDSEGNDFFSLFCSKRAKLPFNFLSILGVPLHFSKLRRQDIQSIVDKIITRVGGWRGRLLLWGKLTLLRSCLASITIYLMSTIKFTK